jgi:hypothetical protein
MTASSWLARPRLLAGLTLAFALVPVWLAFVTYRDARNKDVRLFETSAQLLAKKLKRGLEQTITFSARCGNGPQISTTPHSWTAAWPRQRLTRKGGCRTC